MSEPALSFPIGVSFGPIGATHVRIEVDEPTVAHVRLREQGGLVYEVAFNRGTKRFAKRLSVEKIEEDDTHVRAARSRAMTKQCNALAEVIMKGEAVARRSTDEEAKRKTKLTKKAERTKTERKARLAAKKK